MSTRQPSPEPLLSLAIRQRNLPPGGRNGRLTTVADKAPRIAAPRLTTCDRTTPIGADCAVITAHDEAAAHGKNVLKCISTIKTHLQHTSIEPNIWIHVRRFEIEIVLGRSSCTAAPETGKCSESSRLSLTTPGSSTNAALGGVSAGGIGSPELDVTQSGGGPKALVANQSGGNMGGTTLSKFFA